jgi:hypothetical protein
MSGIIQQFPRQRKDDEVRIRMELTIDLPKEMAD